jgi:hypothetical protein
VSGTLADVQPLLMQLTQELEQVRALLEIERRRF